MCDVVGLGQDSDFSQYDPVLFGHTLFQHRQPGERWIASIVDAGFKNISTRCSSRVDGQSISIPDHFIDNPAGSRPAAGCRHAVFLRLDMVFGV